MVAGDSGQIQATKCRAESHPQTTLSNVLCCSKEDLFPYPLWVPGVAQSRHSGHAGKSFCSRGAAGSRSFDGQYTYTSPQPRSCREPFDCALPRPVHILTQTQTSVGSSSSLSLSINQPVITPIANPMLWAIPFGQARVHMAAIAKREKFNRTSGVSSM